MLLSSNLMLNLWKKSLFPRPMTFTAVVKYLRQVGFIANICHFINNKNVYVILTYIFTIVICGKRIAIFYCSV